MRDLTRRKIARSVSRRLPGLLANYLKAAAVALVHELVTDGVLLEPPKARKSAGAGPRRSRRPSRRA